MNAVINLQVRVCDVPDEEELNILALTMGSAIVEAISPDREPVVKSITAQTEAPTKTIYVQ